MDLKISSSRDTQEHSFTLSELHKKIEGMSKEKQQVERTLEDTLRHAKKDQDDLKKSLHEASEAKELLLTETRTLKRQLDDTSLEAKIQLDASKAELERVQKRLSLYQENHQASEETVNEQSLQIEKLLSTISESERRLQQAQSAISKLEKEKADLKNENYMLLNSKEESLNAFHEINRVEIELESLKKVCYGLYNLCNFLILFAKIQELSQREDDLRMAQLNGQELQAKLSEQNSIHREVCIGKTKMTNDTNLAFCRNALLSRKKSRRRRLLYL